MAKSYTKISVSKETKKLFKECYTEFLKHNPDKDGLYLSEDYIARRICLAYLNRL